MNSRSATGLVTFLVLFGMAVARPPSSSTRHRKTVIPWIEKVTPNAATVGVPNPLQGSEPEFFDLLVVGKLFRPGAVVKWNRKRLKTAFIDSTHLTGRLPFSFLGIYTLRYVRPNSPNGSGLRGMDADGATGKAWIRVRNPGGRTSNRVAFTVGYEVVGG